MQPTNEPINQQPGARQEPVSGPPEPQQPPQITNPSGVAPVSPAPQPSQELPQQSAFNTTPPRPRRALLLAVVIAVCLAVGVLAFFFIQNNSDKSENANTAADESSRNAAPEAKDISSLNNVTFVAPDMGAYGPNAGTDVFANHELLAPVGGTDHCRLSFGVAEPNEMPGTDINSIIQPQIDALTKNGAKVEGPTAGKALVLQSVDDGQSYRMPTLEFTVTRDSAREVDQVSVAILGNNKRAVVMRACANANGQINPDNMSQLQATAEKLKLSTK